MGRPPLDRKAANTARILVALPKSTLKQIDAIAGENGRGKFIREAVRKAIETELRKRERKR
jgi:metal-responsive CopG/Arc/MetJ family transcriptional regulator